MISPRTLVAAAIKDRASFDAVEASKEAEQFTGDLAHIWKVLRDFYARDNKVESALVDNLSSLAVAHLADGKKRKKLAAEIAEIAALPASPDNVREAIREVRRERTGTRLAVALSAKKPREEVDALIAEWQETFAPVEEEKELTYEEALRSRNDQGARMTVYPLRLNKELGGGVLPGHHIILFARPECLSWDTLVRVRSNPRSTTGKNMTLEQFYDRFHGNHHLRGNGPYMIQSVDANGRVFYNEVLDVYPSGSKPCFEITTSSGKSVTASASHVLLTECGDLPVKDVAVGMRILVDAKARGTRLRRREICTKLPFSNYPTRVIAGQTYHRVKEHRLAYDAALNNYSPEAFLRRLREGGEDTLRFSDMSLDIHHKNMNHEDNRPENLELLSRAEHSAIHAAAGQCGNGHRSEHEAIVAIRPVGDRPCYDISMAAPAHNFRVNGGVYVHNCGKTAAAITMAVGFAKKGHKVLYLGNEDPAADLMVRAITAITKKARHEVQSETLVEALKAGLSNIRFIDISPGSLAELEGLVRKHRPQVLVVDQLRNIHVGKSENLTQRLDAAAQGMRAIAKRHGLVAVSLTQAGDSARDRAILDDGDIDSSNTGIPAAADILIGLGSTPQMRSEGARTMTVMKNKVAGTHASFQVRLDPLLSLVRSFDA